MKRRKIFKKSQRCIYLNESQVEQNPSRSEGKTYISSVTPLNHKKKNVYGSENSTENKNAKKLDILVEESMFK